MIERDYQRTGGRVVKTNNVKTADDYDWRDDAFKCWQLAIREMRLAGIREGRYAPLPDCPDEVEAAAKRDGSSYVSDP